MAASAERMSGIIRDLLDFSRARQGTGIPIVRGPVDLHAVAARAILEVQAIHPQHEIDLAAEPDATLDGDEARLLQVVSNLVGNAVQHGAQQSPVAVLIETGPEALLLQVRNEGPPIDPGLLPSIFEPFRRGQHRPRAVHRARDRSRARRQRGGALDGGGGHHLLRAAAARGMSRATAPKAAR
jgi:signal transduction histidine kinase